ncbi:MAG: replicative DNA helicase [Anaerolineae bacterium]|nr:replicative DNA helicase [Anaerolineae bacterium]NUQ03549.1 replicative DNA helicase [Anaerolineae bacterium]
MTNNRQQPLSDGLAPFSQEAEQAVIGAVLVNSDIFLALASFLTSDDFYFVRHVHIWDALRRINDRNDRIDYITLIDELRAHNVLDEVGGPSYLLSLANNTPSAYHAESYGRLVERAAIRRRLLAAADEIKDIARDEQMTTEKVITEAESRLFRVTERSSNREIIPMSEAINSYFGRMEYLYQHPDEPLGLPTGFRDLDKMLGGLQRSDLLIFAGRPGMGKTSFLLSMALNSASLYGARVLIFTMEMGHEQIVQRLLSMETGINTQKMRTGQFTPQEWAKFVHATGRLGSLMVFIDDSPALTPIQMRTKCRRVAHEHGLDLVILDYIQLMSSGGVYENNRVQEISFISRNIKEIARELNVPVFTAAQLSRAVEQRQDKRPQLSDLRESGSLEQDADIVAFLYRDSVYNEASETPNKADIIIAKHRNGPTGTISLYFENSLTRFSDYRTQTIDMSQRS